MSIDYIRIDIFIRKGDPDGLVLNEDSLSSGIGHYYHHYLFLPKLWAEPHVKQVYKTFDNGIPVYKQTKETSPNMRDEM
jgi:hypothetical protein